MRIRPSEVPDKYFLKGIVLRSATVYRIRLEGDGGWVRRAIARKLNVYMKPQLCDQPKIEVYALGPFIGTTPVEPYDHSGALSGLNGQGDVLYDAYVAGSGRYYSDGDLNADVGRYDLHRRGLTLCVKIAGGSMYGAYAASNEVRVALPVIK